MDNTEEKDEVLETIEATLTAAYKAPESALSPEAQAIVDALNIVPSNKELSKPDISRLPNAITRDSIDVAPGDKIIIERRTGFLKGNPYLDTRTYTIKRIDTDSGVLSLWDDDMQQWALDNYVAGLQLGQLYKIPLGRSLPSSNRKRGRPRKLTTSPTPLQDDASPKKGRGRPKGSKNRDQESIKRDKLARNAKRAQKSARRTNKNSP